MGPAERPGAAAAARLRRAGAGAFERAHRALPHALRREQHAGGQLHHAGAVLPPAAPPDVRRAATAAACASRWSSSLPRACCATRAPSRGCRSSPAAASARCWTTRGVEPAGVAPRRLLLRQDLLRPAGRARGAQAPARWRSCASSSCIRSPEEQVERSAGALPGHRRSGLGAGGAAQHGRRGVSCASAAAAARPHRPRGALTSAAAKAPAPPPVRAAGISRSRRRLWPPRSNPAPARACAWWRAARKRRSKARRLLSPFTTIE